VVYLSYIPLLLLMVLAAQLIRRRAYRSFPCFFSYTMFAVAADLARFIVRNHPTPYFWLYWFTEAGYALLGVLVCYEVLLVVARSLARAGWFRVLSGILICLTALAVTLRTIASPPRFDSRLFSIIVTSELAVRLLQGLLFITIVLLVFGLGLRWRQHAFGIAAGFGLYATVSLIMTTIYSNVGGAMESVWVWIGLITYTVTTIIWLWYFRSPEKPETPKGRPGLGVEELRFYKKAAEKMRNQ
jgi:hypothetical protein